MAGGALNLSNGPQNDRGTYITNTLTGYEPAAGRLIESKPCILMAAYIGISPNLVGTIFIHFYDVAVLQVATPNAATWWAASEPLTVPGGTFVWQPGIAEEVEYQNPNTRRDTRDCDPSQPVASIPGVPFDNGLNIVASTTKSNLTLAAANLLRLTVRIRYPAEANLSRR
jgi:hypothetical protein